MQRMTLGGVGGQARMGSSRATIGEMDDEHLLQEIKSANGFHSETMSNEGASFEHFQPVGFTSLPLKQFEDENQGQQGQGGQQGGGGQGGQGANGFNNNQPKGKSAEAVVVYLNGSRDHPVAFISDRRVRPYKLKPGDTASYHSAGTEQKMYISDQGAMLIANNNKSEEKDSQEKERFASLRHVSGEKQKRELKKGDQVPDHKHEGETVNCEVRCTKDRIEFRAGDEVFGFFDKNAKKWNFNGSDMEHNFSETITQTSKKHSNQVEERYETVGNTYLGLDQKDESPPIGETFDTQYKKTFVKLA